MRYKLTGGTLLIFVVLILFSADLKAQKVGLGLGYGDKIENIGGRIDGQFQFHRYFRVSGDIGIYLTKEFPQQKERWNWWSVNLNLDFVFLDLGRFRTYALTGVNYANVKRVFSQTGVTSVESQIGLNAGGGLEYDLNFGSLYSEFRYTFIQERFQQQELNVGLRFYIGRGR